MMAAPKTPIALNDLINVLVLVGLPAGPVNRALSRHAIDSSPDAVMVRCSSSRATAAECPRWRVTPSTG